MIPSLYYRDKFIWESGSTLKNCSHFWRGVIKQFDHFSICSKNKVCNGLETSFWFDRWCGEIKLEYEFPELFELTQNKSDGVYQHRMEGRWKFEFRRNLTGNLVDEY